MKFFKKICAFLKSDRNIGDLAFMKTALASSNLRGRGLYLMPLTFDFDTTLNHLIELGCNVSFTSTKWVILYSNKQIAKLVKQI